MISSLKVDHLPRKVTISNGRGVSIGSSANQSFEHPFGSLITPATPGLIGTCLRGSALSRRCLSVECDTENSGSLTHRLEVA